MNLFNNQFTQHAFDTHVLAIDKLIASFALLADQNDLRQLKLLKSNFIHKTEDFFRADRKLNIGVIGQVKAGKSSFLNTLLFGGREILPKASTPKTATLTKIEYSPVNKIEIEYYSPEEWSVLEDNAAIEQEDELYTAARELVQMVRQAGISPEQELAKGRESIAFDSYEELLGRLNEYVGENGRYTPLVKSVTLQLDKEELKEVSIVDTPGLNDPIISRTIRTKEFIEVCDVVFFLSQASSFLDNSDWKLLSSQLPQKGVKQLVLVASKYDSALRDVLRRKPDDSDDPFDKSANDNETDSIPAAKQMVADKLSARARQQVSRFVEDLTKRQSSAAMIDIISGCQKPVLISSLVCNMSKKAAEEYDKEESNVYQALQAFSDDIHQDIRLIGDFTEITSVFQAAVARKEQLLAQKSASFIPTSIEELRGRLQEIKEREEKRLAILTGSDMVQAAAQRKATERQITAVKADVSHVISEVAVSIETKKSETIVELRHLSTEYSHISDKSGTMTKTGSYSVSTSRWYKPWSWGSSRTEYYTYQEAYTYLDVSDALDNIHRFANDVVSRLESMFAETANITAMKRKLLGVIVNNFDTAQENYDAAFFKLLTEKTLNQIEFPIIKLDSSKKQNAISAKFQGEITAGQEKASLNQMLSATISNIFDEVAQLVEQEIRHFKTGLDAIAGTLLQELLKNMQQEFDEICRQFADKESQMQRINGYIVSLQEQIQKL